jgi:hypothetical protein
LPDGRQLNTDLLLVLEGAEKNKKKTLNNNHGSFVAGISISPRPHNFAATNGVLHHMSGHVSPMPRLTDDARTDAEPD